MCKAGLQIATKEEGVEEGQDKADVAHDENGSPILNKEIIFSPEHFADIVGEKQTKSDDSEPDGQRWSGEQDPDLEFDKYEK